MQRYAHLLLILPIFALDRWTKSLIVDRLGWGDAFPVFSWLAIVHGRNRGGFFGFLSQRDLGHVIFLIVPIAVIAALAYYLVVYRPPLWTRLSLTFVLSGAIGNIYDRIAYGYVVDFILVHYEGYQWPAFNVADSAITFGIGLWLYTQLFTKEGARKSARR
jgi:signal peptidase II